MSPFCLRPTCRIPRPAIPALVYLGLLFVTGGLLARPARADAWALLIGIDQYADSNRISNLGGAAADARALAKTLVDTAGFSDLHIQLLVSDGDAATRPTRVEILNALTRLAANAKAGDTVFVLYSGHGIEIDGTSYLLPYDTSALSNADIVDSALETEKFTSRLRKIKARAIVLAFDMCRSDPRKRMRAIGGETDNKLSKAVVRGLEFSHVAGTGAAPAASPAGPSIAITFYSCSPNERSYEDRLQSRGYFSEFLEKGLRGGAADAGGTVRVASLAKYLEKNVHTAVAEAENGASQTPYPELKGPGVAEFVLAHKPGGSAAEPPLTTAHPDKMVLRYRARAGQTERIRGTAVLTPFGSDSRLILTEFDKIACVAVDPQSGEITTKTTTERLTASSSGGIPSPDTPGPLSLTMSANGKLVSVKSIPDSAESAVARRRQAIGLFFSDKPVGPGDKWSHDYDANPAMGTPSAHGDFEITAVSVVEGVRQFKIRMSYSERGAKPIVTQGIYIIDPETGDVFSEDVEISGLAIGGNVMSGKLHNERIEGGASVP